MHQEATNAATNSTTRVCTYTFKGDLLHVVVANRLRRPHPVSEGLVKNYFCFKR